MSALQDAQSELADAKEQVVGGSQSLSLTHWASIVNT